jgi:hypothetical protein
MIKSGSYNLKTIIEIWENPHGRIA